MSTSKSIKLDEPRLSMAEHSMTLPAEITDRTFFEFGIIENCTIEQQEAHRVRFDQVIFRNVVFTDTALAGIELTDVRFEHCDLSNVDFNDAVIHRTVFYNCKMIGIQLAGSTLRNVRIEQCLADYANFRYTNAKQMIIEHSQLKRADFGNATLKNIELVQLHMDQSYWSGTPLGGIDLSDWEFYSLEVNAEDLRGCTIASEQAYIFAALLGLKLKD